MQPKPQRFGIYKASPNPKIPDYGNGVCAGWATLTTKITFVALALLKLELSTIWAKKSPHLQSILCLEMDMPVGITNDMLKHIVFVCFFVYKYAKTFERGNHRTLNPQTNKHRWLFGLVQMAFQMNYKLKQICAPNRFASVCSWSLANGLADGIHGHCSMAGLSLNALRYHMVSLMLLKNSLWTSNTATRAFIFVRRSYLASGNSIEELMSR